MLLWSRFLLQVLEIAFRTPVFFFLSPFGCSYTHPPYCITPAPEKIAMSSSYIGP